MVVAAILPLSPLFSFSLSSFHYVLMAFVTLPFIFMALSSLIHSFSLFLTTCSFGVSTIIVGSTR